MYFYFYFFALEGPVCLLLDGICPIPFFSLGPPPPTRSSFDFLEPYKPPCFSVHLEQVIDDVKYGCPCSPPPRLRRGANL